MWKKYVKKVTSYVEMRPYILGEDLTGVSVSEPDKNEVATTGGGMIAKNPDNPNDRWYVAKEYMKNYVEM